MKKIIYILALASTLLSCSKEIELDYKDIDVIPVIEGHLTPEAAEVKITKSRNMDDSTKCAGLRVDDVRIIAPDGSETPLKYQQDGCYRPDNKINPTEGETYTLKVTIDGVEYTGSSTMMNKVEITEPQFVWANLMDWMQVMECETTNIPEGYEAYGWARIHRNGKFYMSGVAKTKGDSPIDIGLYYDSDMENDKDMILESGDKLYFELRTIDEKVYNYISEYNQNSNNPRQFFSTSVEDKICLGFFAVYDQVVYDITYVKTAHE